MKKTTIHGSKKGQSQPQRPHIAPDTLVSQDIFKGLYGLCEGEILGLADGGKSIKLDGTPLINANGQPNFTDITWDFRTGTHDQTPILGFPAIENEQAVGVELTSDRAWTKAISNRELSAVRIRLNFGALKEQKESGDVLGLTIEYAIDVQTNDGAFIEVAKFNVTGKSSSNFKRSHRINLPQSEAKSNRWTIRVRRITPNRHSDLVSDRVHIDALTEIIDAKLSYPATALLGLSYNAKTFNNIAKIAVRLKGKIIQVPSNYNPVARTYNGLWDGTFKMAYSNNPAWVFYDLCTATRYGLGERLAGLLDKWRLYQIGQYCDEMVDDGKGGTEPRFTCNVYIQKADDAYRVLQNIASTFRGMSFWDGSQIVLDSDTPKDPVYTFSPTNVISGEFSYTGTRSRDRHTVVKAAWDNPDNNYQTEYEFVKDERAMSKDGVKILDISAFGCTSRGQAQRAGLWALKSEQYETRTVSFKTGLQGFIPQVGQVINIADDVFAGRAISGKVVAVTKSHKQITLDRTAGRVGDTLTIATADGIKSAIITAITQQGEQRQSVVTLDKSVQGVTADNTWALISDDLRLMQFRILTIKQDGTTFDITALAYNLAKFTEVDTGAIIPQAPISAIKLEALAPPPSVSLTSTTRTHQGQAITTLTINWEQVQGATAYIVEWRKDNGNWQTLPRVSGQSVDIEGVYQGQYIARVRAVDSFDNESLATASTLTNIAGKTGKPPRLVKLTAQGKLFAMDLAWVFNKGSDDTNFTEIEVSPDGRSNITTLGTFAYPTNKHEITGLQGNLTQFYRGRIVDKLGNTSDWTAWVSGTTEARADKVLDILSGQINQSHLDQSLRTPIGKIGTLESAVNAVNGQLPSLNNQIATLNGRATALQNELNTAKSTLQTAVSNITTERNRISSAIRDITALQSANNAKTQEIANLTQTVGGHTSLIRELGVTTGDLSQKYSQLKTATDTANSEITAIKQTQNGQATSIERLGAKFDNLSVGGRNLLLNTGTFKDWQFSKHNSETTTRLDPVDGVATLTGTQAFWKQWYQTSKQDTVASRPFANALLNDVVDGQNYVISYEAKGDVPLRLFVRLYYTDNTSHNTVFVSQTLTDNWQRYTHTVTLAHAQGKADLYRHLSFIIEHNRIGTLQIRKVKLEKGNIATDWTPAPEDLQADIDGKASTANLETLRQTLTSADTALGQRIDTLTADYNGNKANVANQLKTLSDKDTATANQISSLTASVTTAQNTANTANGKADTATTKADNAQSTANNALNRANTANSAITNEQKARADADSALGQRITAMDTAYKSADTQINAKLANAEKAISDNNTALSQRISALDTAYKKSDTDITARLAREETARTNGDNANAQALRTLESTVQGVSGRVGTSESRIANLERTTADTNQALTTAQSQLTAKYDDLSARGKVRANLLPNGGFEQGLLGWTGSAPFVVSEHPSFGRVAYLDGVVGKSGTFTLISDKIPAEAGRGYVISCDSAFNGTRCRMYCDIQFYNAQGLMILDGNQAPFEGVHDFAVIANRHEAYTQAPQGATHMVARFVVENLSGGTYVAVRQIKIETGHLPSTPYTADTLGKNLSASIDEFKRTQATKDSATAQKLSQLESGLGTKANATALNELNTRVAQVDGKITAEAQKVATLQTTVNGQSASIQQHAQSLNGLSAQWMLKVQSGNIVSGIGLASNNGVSDFAIRADKFYVAPPTGTTKTPLFSVITTPTTLNGVAVPVGNYLSDAFIQNGTITNAKIANGAISSAKIAYAQIDTAHIANGAIDSAKIRDGSITTAKIGHAQIDTLQIADGAVVVPRARFLENAGSITLGQKKTLIELSIEAIAGMAVVINARLKPTGIVVQRNGIWRSNSPQYALIAILSKNGQEIKRDNLVNNNDGSILGDFILFGYVDVAHNGVNNYKLELHFAHHWDNAYRDTSATIADASLSLMLVKK